MKIISTTVVAVIAFVTVVLGMNMFTVVDDGTVKTQMFLGKVSPDVLKPGPTLVNPFSSLDTYSTKDIVLKFEHLMIPSQDKYKTDTDLTVMLKFDGNKAPMARINAGNMEQAINKYVETKLTSTVREFGKSVEKAQDMYRADVQNGLQDFVKNEVNNYAAKYGFTVMDVQIQDVSLDPVIQKYVAQTKSREEAINQSKADLETAENNAQKAVKVAEADRQSRENAAIASEREADAKLYAATKEAAANVALQATITPAMLEWQRLRVEEIKAKGWNGQLPTTVMGTNDSTSFLMDVRSKE